MSRNVSVKSGNIYCGFLDLLHERLNDKQWFADLRWTVGPGLGAAIEPVLVGPRRRRSAQQYTTDCFSVLSTEPEDVKLLDGENYDVQQPQDQQEDESENRRLPKDDILHGNTARVHETDTICSFCEYKIGGSD